MFLWTAALNGPQTGHLNLSQTVTSNEDVPLMRYGEHENLSDISHQIHNHCTKNLESRIIPTYGTVHYIVVAWCITHRKLSFLKQSLWTLAVGFMSVRLSFASVHSAFLFSCLALSNLLYMLRCTAIFHGGYSLGERIKKCSNIENPQWVPVPFDTHRKSKWRVNRTNMSNLILLLLWGSLL